MNKIGFFGGCFNPVTYAHIILVKKTIKKYKLDKVYFVPMGDLYSKKDLAPLINRIEMLKIAFEKEKKIDILIISNKDKKTDAIDTFKLIDKDFSEVERYFIMGTDNYEKIASWKGSNDLLTNYKFIILDRTSGITKDISSTIVRDKLKNNEDIDGLIPNQVFEYIKRNNLYR